MVPKVALKREDHPDRSAQLVASAVVDHDVVIELAGQPHSGAHPPGQSGDTGKSEVHILKPLRFVGRFVRFAHRNPENDCGANPDEETQTLNVPGLLEEQLDSNLKMPFLKEQATGELQLELPRNGCNFNEATDPSQADWRVALVERSQSGRAEAQRPLPMSSCGISALEGLLGETSSRQCCS